MPSMIVVAETGTDELSTFQQNRRAFQLKKRMTSSAVREPHVAAQVMERIGWALSDAESERQAALSIGVPLMTAAILARGAGKTRPREPIMHVVEPAAAGNHAIDARHWRRRLARMRRRESRATMAGSIAAPRSGTSTSGLSARGLDVALERPAPTWR